MVSICAKQTEFYNEILRKLKIWNKVDPKEHYFIGGGKICGLEKGIKDIMEDEYLHPSFKKNHLKVINIDKGVYDNFSKLLWAQKTGSEFFRNISCINIMLIMKNIGNAVYKAGNLEDAALQLYVLGVIGLGRCGLQEHEQCDKDKKKHDVLLASLYNNISVMFYIQKKYEKAAHAAKDALHWNGDHEKCKKRLRTIEKMLID